MKKSIYSASVFLCYLLIELLTQAPVILFADDGYYFGSGYDVYPLENTDIQLVAETIVITFDYEGNKNVKGASRHLHYLIEVDMSFRNHGPSVSVQMGFPVFITGDVNEPISEENYVIDTQFRTWVNDVEVAIVRKKGIPNPIKPAWNFSDTVLTYSVSFKVGETKKIRHYYRVGGGGTSSGDWQLGYILRTGALWKGEIENFSMIFKTRISELPAYYGFEPREQRVEVKEGGEIRFFWNFKNFEPKKDFLARGNSTRTHREKSMNSLFSSLLVDDIEWCSNPEFEGAPNIDRQKFGNASAMELRYIKNKFLASYGYPFSNPFVRAQFYFPYSPFKENSNFSYARMAKEHLACLNALAKAEKEKLKEEEKEFGIQGCLKATAPSNTEYP